MVKFAGFASILVHSEWSPRAAPGSESQCWTTCDGSTAEPGPLKWRGRPGNTAPSPATAKGKTLYWWSLKQSVFLFHGGGVNLYSKALQNHSGSLPHIILIQCSNSIKEKMNSGWNEKGCKYFRTSAQIRNLTGINKHNSV